MRGKMARKVFETVIDENLERLWKILFYKFFKFNMPDEDKHKKTKATSHIDKQKINNMKYKHKYKVLAIYFNLT